MFRDYYSELRVEEIYNEYIKLKDKIFDCAGSNNDIKCVKKYIRYGYNINIQDSKYNQTPLMYAAANGHYDIVKLLLDNGANPNIYPKNMENSYLAAERLGYKKIAQILKPITQVTTRPNQSSSSKYVALDLKNMCLGGSGAYKSFCYNIGSSDLKNTCLGLTDYPDFCYNIGNPDLKNFCLGASGQYQDFCYIIQDSDLKNACLGSTKGSDFCFNIQDSNLKSMCLGISNTSNNCYNIR